MTPLDVFHRLLKDTGYAATLLPGGGTFCGCDKSDRVIYIGQDLDPVTQGIVGLHELGHAVCESEFYSFRYVVEVAYCIELQAWAWAESKMPPGYEEQFEALKEYGLSSYR